VWFGSSLRSLLRVPRNLMLPRSYLSPSLREGRSLSDGEGLVVNLTLTTLHLKGSNRQKPHALSRAATRITLSKKEATTRSRHCTSDGQKHSCNSLLARLHAALSGLA